VGSTHSVSNKKTVFTDYSYKLDRVWIQVPSGGLSPVSEI
jgi:hypothetical protein